MSGARGDATNKVTTMKTKKCNHVFRELYRGIRICTLPKGHAGDCDGSAPECTIQDAKLIKAFWKREQAALQTP